MKITLEHIGRRYNREWIFRDLNTSFLQGSSYAVLGRNGSGKSTLLQLIAGSLTPSEGTVSYYDAGKPVDGNNIFNHISIAAPYLELIEEFTLSELIDFHFSFKTYRKELDAKAVIELLGFERSKNKPLKYFSSGMKQRSKLALAFCADTPVLLLDEPTSNLDAEGVSWYLNLISGFAQDRLVIVCSNQEHEYSFCGSHIHIADYK